MSAPKTKKSPSLHVNKNAIDYQLKELLDARGLSSYAVARLAGIAPGMVTRFRSGQRGLTIASLTRIAEALNLRLVEVGTRKVGTRKVQAAAEPAPSPVSEEG